LAEVILEKVTKRFGKVVAINEISLDIKEGEFFVLLGPSSASKTTTLRSVAGLEQIDGGEIYINNNPVKHLSPAQRNIAFVFQYYNLYPHMTVKENLLFPLKADVWDIEHGERERRVAKVSKTLHIEHLLDRRVSNLSGGEMQRVGIGRAIGRNPDIFLMDEPLSNLDAKLREEMRIELKRLQSEIGSTIFFVTHDQVEAMSLADRVAVLEKGVIQQIGTPDDIYTRPGNTTVALSVGSPPINLIDAVIEDDRLKMGPGIYDLGEVRRPSEPESGRPKGEVILGVRPEDITLFQTSRLDVFRAEVYLVNYMGHACYVELKAGSQILTAKVPSDFDVRIGENVWAAFEKDRVLVFDRETRKRIGLSMQPPVTAR